MERSMAAMMTPLLTRRGSCRLRIDCFVSSRRWPTPTTAPPCLDLEKPRAGHRSPFPGPHPIPLIMASQAWMLGESGEENLENPKEFLPLSRLEGVNRNEEFNGFWHWWRQLP
ncbi:hypothetical protein ABZP36_011507 [Zizania latifolia]